MNEDDGTRDGVTLLRNTGAEGRVSASRVTRRLPPPDRTSALLLSQRNRYVHHDSAPLGECRHDQGARFMSEDDAPSDRVPSR